MNVNQRWEKPLQKEGKIRNIRVVIQKCFKMDQNFNDKDISHRYFEVFLCFWLAIKNKRKEKSNKNFDTSGHPIETYIIIGKDWLQVANFLYSPLVEKSFLLK